MIVQDPEAVLDAAHTYAQRGWRVLPLHGVTPEGNCTCLSAKKPTCNSAGKHPVENVWQNTPALSGADIQATFEDQNRNVGIATGEASGFWVLDIDLDKPGTEERLRDLQAGRKFPPTRIVRTPGGGYHYYFACPDFRVTNSAKRLPDGVDVRGSGGQVVAPPSVSAKGQYTEAMDAPIADAPGWLLELVRPLPPAAPVDLATVPKLTDLPEAEQKRLAAYTDRIVEDEVARLKECREKGWSGPPWNTTTFEVSCTLVELANSPWCFLSLVGARGFVMEFAPRDREFGDEEVEGCFASALKTVAGKGRALPPNRQPDITIIPGDPLTDPTAGAAPTNPGEAAPSIVLRDWSDLGNARRMVDLYGDRLRWVPEAKEWAVYTDGCWIMEGASAGLALAQDMVEGLIDREAGFHSDAPTGPNGDKPSERELFVKWARGQQMSSRIDACLRQATGRPELLAKMTDFDRQEHLLNVANGVVDLRTGDLTEHRPDLLQMLQSPVAYVPDAPATRWQAFLDRCLPDRAVQDYLQKAIGYSLTGSMAEQALFIHHGSGANGKSVFLIIASHLAGGYGQVVPRETLLAKGATTEHPTSVARMRGRRFLQASETAAGRRLDEETVKGLTGGEQQTARFMGANFFDFTPTGKIHFVTNHLPRLTDAESIWRRLHLIGWLVTIPVEERDPRLAEKIITEEAEGVLAWAVAGAARWYAERLTMPDTMRIALADYRTDQDILGEFLSGRLEADRHAFTATSDIYGAYQAWCFNNGIKSPMTAQDLGRALRERKFTQKRTGQHRGFAVRLIPNAVQEVEDPLLTR